MLSDLASTSWIFFPLQKKIIQNSDFALPKKNDL